MEDATIKSFEVPRGVWERLQSSAVPERLKRMNPGAPLVVDETKAPDQFGLRPRHVKELERSILHGTGREEGSR